MNRTLDISEENYINGLNVSFPADQDENRSAGGKNKEWNESKGKISQHHIEHKAPQTEGEDMVKQAYDVKQIFNVEKSNNSVRQIDDKKLLFPIHVDFKAFETPNCSMG